MDIQQEIDHIMAGIESERAQRQAIETNLRNFLAMQAGDEWHNCALMRHDLPIDGRIIYTAITWVNVDGGSVGVVDRQWKYAPKKAACCLVVARDEYGQFQLAPHCPVTGSEEM